MKKEVLRIIVLFAACIALFTSCGKKDQTLIQTYTKHQEAKIVEIEEKIIALKSEYIPIRFQVTDRTDSSIEVSVKFMFSSGEDGIIKKYILEGKELHFDFFQIPLSKDTGRYCIVPYRIYTDRIAPKDGQSLLTPVLMNGPVPMCYSENNFHKKDIANITKSISELKEGQYVSDKHAFGSVVHDNTGISSYKTGSIYRIISRTSGGIEVIEE